MVDWQTHVVLAAKLLKTCEKDVSASIYSELPAADREPAHFHRVRFHIIHYTPDLVRAGIQVFTGKEMGIKEDSYEHKRLTAEYLDHFQPRAIKGAQIVGDPAIAKASSDLQSAALSCISHLYFDTPNNPVQAFIPLSSYGSAEWDLWNEIDYLKFRKEFYEPEYIDEFRKKMVDNKVWNTKLNPDSMMKAMIVRLGEKAQPSIGYDVIDKTIANFFKDLYGEDFHTHIKKNKEYQFCLELEKEMFTIIRKMFPKH